MDVWLILFVGLTMPLVYFGILRPRPKWRYYLSQVIYNLAFAVYWRMQLGFFNWVVLFHTLCFLFWWYFFWKNRPRKKGKWATKLLGYKSRLVMKKMKENMA